MRPVISFLTALLIAVSIHSIDSFTAIPSCNNLSTKSTSVTSNSRLMARKNKDEDKDTAPAINPAKKAALDGVLQRIERNYGRGSIVKLGKSLYMI